RPDPGRRHGCGGDPEADVVAGGHVIVGGPAYPADRQRDQERPAEKDHEERERARATQQLKLFHQNLFPMKEARARTATRKAAGGETPAQALESFRECTSVRAEIWRNTCRARERASSCAVLC